MSEYFRKYIKKEHFPVHPYHNYFTIMFLKYFNISIIIFILKALKSNSKPISKTAY